MRVRYTGPAGLIYAPIGGAAFEPAPDEVLDLDEDLVATLGPDFDPVDASEVFDPAKATKRELVAFVDEHGLGDVIDRSLLVEDLRKAVTAYLDATAPADGDTPTGQEG